MRDLIAGEGGGVFALAATRGAQALACEGLGSPTHAPSGVPVYPVDALPDALDVERVVLVACERQTRAVVGAWGRGHGSAVVEAVPDRLPKPDGVRVVAVTAASTASGKTALTRRVARTLSRSGVRVCVARHPIANLLLWDRFDTTVVRTPDELRSPRPLEEREELAPLVGASIPVAVGLDPTAVLHAAAREAERGVVVWDGGGAAEPWVDTDLTMVVVDLLREMRPEIEARVATAGVVVLTKADSADSGRARQIESAVRAANPEAPVVLADLSVGVAQGGELKDRRVVVVEDWSSLVLGGFAAGAGAIAARRFRCGVVDPRPFAKGAIKRVLDDQAHIGAVIPSLGRTPDEIDDLASSISATPGDAILWASNADPATVVPGEHRQIIRAYGELTEVAGPSLQELLSPVMQ
jgi:predicted GTPase